MRGFWLVLLLVAGCTSSSGVQRTAMTAACASHAVPAMLESDTLTVLTLNIGHGRQRAFNQMVVTADRTRDNLDRISAVLRRSGADVVALQETDAPSRWSGEFHHTYYLRDHTPLACALQGVHSDSWLASYGSALLTRTAMDAAASVTFPASPPTNSKGFVTAQIQWQRNGTVVPVTLVSLHLDFSRKSVRDRQVDILVDALREIDTPLVVLGDFNSSWNEDDSHVRQLATALDLSAYGADLEGLGSYKSIDGKRLDWILISEDLAYADYRVLPDKLSDHLAVRAELRMKPAEVN